MKKDMNGNAAWAQVLVGLALAGASTFSLAEIIFPAIDRPAMQVKDPGHAVLQAAAIAGENVIVVGEHGIIAISKDAGSHWTQSEQVPTSVTLTAVTFVGRESGWAVGHGGVVLHTSNGGKTWVKQTDGRKLARLALDVAQKNIAIKPDDKESIEQLNAAQLLLNDGPDKPLMDVLFLNSEHGFVIGAYNMFFETMDAGQTWHAAMGRLKNPKGLHLYAIRSDGKNLFIAGEQGLLVRSSNNGTTFENLKSPYNGSWFSLAPLVDGGLVLAGLRGNAYYSSDSGDNWARLEGSGGASFVNAMALPHGGFLLTNQAGQLLQGKNAAPMASLKMPPLPQIAAVLQLSKENLLAVGMVGAVTLHFDETSTTGVGQ